MQKKLIISLCWACCLVLFSFSFNPVQASASELPGNEMKNVPEVSNAGVPAVSSFQTDQLIDANLVAQVQPDNGSEPIKGLFLPFKKKKDASRPVPPPQQQQVQSDQPDQPDQPPTPVLPEVQQQPVTQQPAEQPPVTLLPQQPAAKRGDVSFNFDDADVFSVIQTIFGDVLKVNYIVDARVKGRVNFRSVAPVAKEDVLPLMEVILRLNGIGIVEEGGLYRIVPIGDLPKEPASVGIGREPEAIKITGKALVQVVPVLNVQSTDMVKLLTPFLSANAVIIDVPKSNHVVIIDTDTNVKRLLRLVEIFDSEKLKQIKPQVFVYSVQNGKAKDVASILQQVFLGSKSSTTGTAGKPAATPKTAVPGQTQQPPAPDTQPQVFAGAAGGESTVSEGTRIIPDETNNSIVVLSTPQDYAAILFALQQIDIIPRQVLIEGLIVQVKLTNNLSFGFSWSVNTDLNITNMNPFTKDVNLNGDININSPATAVSNLPAKGFTFVGKDPTGTARAVLTALSEESNAKVLAAPHILVSDNHEARIQVGSQVPLTTSQTSTTVVSGTAPSITDTIQYKDIGIILKVKPQVNDSGLISLELSQEISSIGDISVDVGGLKNITIDKIEAASNLVAQDGETIIIGGLIREDSSKSKDGIPFLSKIPIIGHLFGNTTNDTTRTELVILLTPHVIRGQKEAGAITTDYINRYKGSAHDKEIEEFIKARSNPGRKGEAGEESPKNSGQGNP